MLPAALWPPLFSSAMRCFCRTTSERHSAIWRLTSSSLHLHTSDILYRVPDVPHDLVRPSRGGARPLSIVLHDIIGQQRERGPDRDEGTWSVCRIIISTRQILLNQFYETALPPGFRVNSVPFVRLSNTATASLRVVIVAGSLGSLTIEQDGWITNY